MRPTRLSLLLVLLIGNAESLPAAEHFVCDCAAGAEAGCLAGDDANGGSQASPWRSYEKARQAFATLGAGDRVRFCRGGAWDVSGAGTRWVNAACRAETRCTVDAYVPSWGSAQSARPILRRLDGEHGFGLDDGGAADHEEGYLFEALDLRGSGQPSNGFFFYNDVDDVTIRDVAISGFGIGVHVAGSNACGPDPECDGRNERIVVERATIVDNEVQGWLGGSSGSQILDSYFEGNGTTAVFDHNIYVSGAATAGMRVVGNRLFQSTLDANGICQAVSLVVHGQHANLRIEGNEVWEDVGKAGQGCWGIAVDPGYGSAESFIGVVLRGNVVRDVGNVGIGVASCVGCRIEDNVVVQRNAFGITAIAAPDRARGAEDAAMDAVVVRNNSIYVGAGSGGTAIRVDTEGTGHVVASNAVHYAGTSSSFNCQDTDLATASYQDIDYNLCYFPSASGAEWANGMGSLAQWQTASGFDADSSVADPGFTDPAAADLRPIDEAAATVDSGHPTLSSPVEIGGAPRDLLPDRGAYEWGVEGIFADGFESGDLSAWLAGRPTSPPFAAGTTSPATPNPGMPDRAWQRRSPASR